MWHGYEEDQHEFAKSVIVVIIAGEGRMEKKDKCRL